MGLFSWLFGESESEALNRAHNEGQTYAKEHGSAAGDLAASILPPITERGKAFDDGYCHARSQGAGE